MKDYLSWNEANNLICISEKEGKYNIALLIYISIHTGMRINDILRLKWRDIIYTDVLCFTEERTAKNRCILITTEMETYFYTSYIRMNKPTIDNYCFMSQKRNVFTVQRINQILKSLTVKCQLPDVILTTNSLRKTFGRELYNRTNGEAIAYLSDYFSHPSVRFTLDYLRIDNCEGTQYLFPL